MAQFWPPPPLKILRGTVSGVSLSAYTNVSFPTGFFTAPPTVVPVSGFGVSAYPYLSAVTVAGFGVAINSSTPSRVDWIATGI